MKRWRENTQKVKDNRSDIYYEKYSFQTSMYD